MWIGFFQHFGFYFHEKWILYEYWKGFLYVLRSFINGGQKGFEIMHLIVRGWKLKADLGLSMAPIASTGDQIIFIVITHDHRLVLYIVNVGKVLYNQGLHQKCNQSIIDPKLSKNFNHFFLSIYTIYKIMHQNI